MVKIKDLVLDLWAVIKWHCHRGERPPPPDIPALIAARTKQIIDKLDETEGRVVALKEEQTRLSASMAELTKKDMAKDDIMFN
jgi:hypothetical protein